MTNQSAMSLLPSSHSSILRRRKIIVDVLGFKLSWALEMRSGGVFGCGYACNVHLQSLAYSKQAQDALDWTKDVRIVPGN
jgi:hypothetical protein